MLKIGILGDQHAHLFSAFINGVNWERFEKRHLPGQWQKLKKVEKKALEFLGMK